jgi:hypothetical protein
VTATVPGREPARRQPARQSVRQAARKVGSRRGPLSTPLMLRTLLVVLVLLSLAWGAFGGWVASQHSSAVSTLVSVDEPLSVDARQMYESIADADVTITTAYLPKSQTAQQSQAEQQQLFSQVQHYDSDIATAATELGRLQAAGGDQAVVAALAAVDGGLAAYKGYVEQAETMYAVGRSPAGGSFLQVASEEAHLVLLPAAKTVFTERNAALSASSDQATGLPTIIAALVLAAITGIALFRTQRWNSRRTNRVVSPGLVIASVLLVVSAAWMAGSFLQARSDLDRGIGQGSAPAENLALASIGVQQIRGDAVLNVISRTGGAEFSDDFHATSKQIGPGPGSLLSGAAAAQQPSGRGASLVAAAQSEATSWYTANSGVYAQSVAANYAKEIDMVIGAGQGNSAAGYRSLEDDIHGAINSDQVIFSSAASAGASELDPLEPLVIVASLLMALGCVWGITRRLAEYR